MTRDSQLSALSSQLSLAPRYRVVGVLIPVLATDESDQALIAAAPMEVDIVLRSTHPDFVARAARWVVALGYAAWRWQSPPEVTRMEEELSAFSSQLSDFPPVPGWLRELQEGDHASLP